MRCIKILLLCLISFGSIAQHDIIQKATYPKVAMAIYKHESNHGKSKLATKYNNVYGFKGGKRAIGRTPSKYSIYKSKEDSALDYLDFEEKMIRKYNLTTKRLYLSHLSKRYARDKTWINKIKKLMI